jgi:predicted nuclease of predicted toxin-antitoxin system
LEFFADRNLGSRIFPQIVRQSGITLHRHTDHFAHDAPDREWLPVVANRGWIILSSDAAIMRNPLERDAVMGSRAALLVLVGANATAQEIARNFVNTHPRILRFLQKHPSPLIAKVYRPNPPALVAQGRPGRIELKLS